MNVSIHYGIDLGDSESHGGGIDLPDWFLKGKIEEELAKRITGKAEVDWIERNLVLESAGLEVHFYGYLGEGYSSYMLVIPESEVSDLGCQFSFRPADLVVGSDWDARLYRAAALLEVGEFMPKYVPQWHATAVYG
jgi:hypothetical protein